MERLTKFLLIAILTAGIIFGSLIYIYFSLMGRLILTRELERITYKKVTIGHLDISPALGLDISNLNIEGLVKADKVFISPNYFTLFTGKLIFNKLKLVRPEFNFNKIPPPVVPQGLASSNADVSVPVPFKPPKEARFLPVGFNRIKILDGKVNFIDQSISADGIKIAIKDINCNISNMYFFSYGGAASNFELSGKIPWREGQAQGQIDLEGWINYREKDMRATLKIKDIDAVYLYPYYSKWVDLEKARIEKAKLNFTAEINGLKNKVTAECRLELTDMVRKPLEPGQSDEKAAKITDKVLDMFKNIDQGRVELNFTIRTKMDNPQFGFGNFKSAFEDKITKGRAGTGLRPEQVLIFPVKVVESGVRSFTDLTRAMVDGVFAVGEEIAKSTGAVFAKEEAEKTK